jgi:hypothetical protein
MFESLPTIVPLVIIAFAFVYGESVVERTAITIIETTLRDIITGSTFQPLQTYLFLPVYTYVLKPMFDFVILEAAFLLRIVYQVLACILTSLCTWVLIPVWNLAC